MSPCLEQQMAWAVALWPRSQARWLPGYYGRPAATWPPLPMCAVAEPAQSSSLLGLRRCLLLCTRELVPGTGEELPPVPS